MRKDRFEQIKIAYPKEVKEDLEPKAVPGDGETKIEWVKRKIDTKVKYTDFRVSTLMSVGATDLLKECPKMDGSKLDVADGITNSVMNVPVEKINDEQVK